MPEAKPISCFDFIAQYGLRCPSPKADAGSWDGEDAQSFMSLLTVVAFLSAISLSRFALPDMKQSHCASFSTVFAVYRFMQEIGSNRNQFRNDWISQVWYFDAWLVLVNWKHLRNFKDERLVEQRAFAGISEIEIVLWRCRNAANKSARELKKLLLVTASFLMQGDRLQHDKLSKTRRNGPLGVDIARRKSVQRETF